MSSVTDASLKVKRRSHLKCSPSRSPCRSGQVLDAAHNENPVRANVIPLERFLEYTASLPGMTTYILLIFSMPCPTLTLESAIRAQVAILKAWARTRRHW